MFKPSCLLGLQVAPTTVIISQGSQTFYPTHSPVGCLPWEWYRYMPESGNSHGGTFTRWIAALSAAPRPCAPHRYSHPRGSSTSSFSLIIGTTGSRVPHKSLAQVHATFMPDAAQAVNRFPLDLSRSSVSPQFRRHRYLFSTPRQWFACARLPECHLTQSQPCLFRQRSPQRLLTHAA